MVFDPLRQIQGETDINGALLRVWAIAVGRYIELTPAEGIVATGQSVWLETVGLGLTLWLGEFEDTTNQLWLCWCDRSGQVIPTGVEGQQIAQQRADVERQRAERLEALLRRRVGKASRREAACRQTSQGIEPNQ
ncbi:MAG: hypothetical protein KME23_21740 [Goleter apudmare HA4340-LM2]|nr:hypothetical protein [Goleter apudmare HA4340-LM2]